MKIQLRVLVLLCAIFCAPSMWGMSDDEQKQLNRRLYDASRDGNTDQVVQLLKQKAQVNSANGWRYSSPLYGACHRGHTEIAELLLANKAAIDQADRDGETPLFLACSRGHIEVVELLLANKAAIDQANQAGSTPLHRACWDAHKELVELLLANKAAINQADKCDETPLYTVCNDYNRRQTDARSHIIELLINGGADTQAVAKQLANTPASKLVAKLVQASPKGKRKRAKPSDYVDKTHGE